MAQELTLKTNTTPSYFNKDTALGGMLGLVVGGLALNLFIPGGGLIAAAAGAVVGGMMGKKRQEHENAHGKQVGEPSFWNKDTVIGGLIGIALAGVAALATGLVAIGGTAAVAAAAPAAAPVVAGLGLLAMAAAVVGAPILGTYIGGRMGKKRQERELEEAKQQTIVENISRTVSPEIGQAVAYTMEHNKQWGKQVLEDKLLASAQAQEPLR